MIYFVPAIYFFTNFKLLGYLEVACHNQLNFFEIACHNCLNFLEVAYLNQLNFQKPCRRSCPKYFKLAEYYLL